MTSARATQRGAVGGGGVGQKDTWVRGERGEMGDSAGDGGEKHRVLAVKTVLLYKCCDVTGG